jgi:aryl-alcohol dehydrogenase-like predicted oxidoreductase
MENKEFTVENSGLRVSPIGFGCFPIGGKRWGQLPPRREIIRTLMKAPDLGVTFFDTAPIYGFGASEELLGEVFGRNGRNAYADVVIASKFGLSWNERGHVSKDAKPTTIRNEVEQSLRRLNRERIDLYQLHWPDPATPLEEIIATLDNLQQEGKIGAYGACNLGSDQLTKAPWTSLQESFSLVDQAKAPLFTAAKTRGISTLSYQSIGRGILSGKYVEQRPRFGKNDVRFNDPNFTEPGFANLKPKLQEMKNIAADYKVSIASLALAWNIAQANVTAAICGIKTAQQLTEAADAMTTRLDKTTVQQLNQLFE